MQVTHEQLDSSVVNAAAAMAAAGATSQQPLHDPQLQQQQQQQQYDCVAHIAGGQPSCDPGIQQPEPAAGCQIEPQQHQQQRDEHSNNQAHPSSSRPANGCSTALGSSGDSGCGGGAAAADCAQVVTPLNGSSDGCTVPRQGERVSLTIRRVLKVHKALGILRR